MHWRYTSFILKSLGLLNICSDACGSLYVTSFTGVLSVSSMDRKDGPAKYGMVSYHGMLKPLTCLELIGV